jgi:peptide/nickel transport system ATP-binding protein
VDLTLELPDGAPNAGARMTEAPPLRDGATVLEVADLSVSFTRHHAVIRAVRNVSLKIGAGEIVGLVGESGSGKSVLAHTILGLTERTPSARVSGAVVIDGESLIGIRGSRRRALVREHLGAVFQDPMTSLNPSLRIGRQLAEVCDTSERATELLDAVGIADATARLNAYPHELSGGQRQRVMLAMAVAREPTLIVADEPTTALDVTVQAQILKLLRRLSEDHGCSVLLITHDLGVAAEIVDRILVMYAGRIAEEGPSRAVLERPRHPYTQGLLASRLRLDDPPLEKLQTLQGVPPNPAELPPGCPFAPRCVHREKECDDVLPELEPLDRAGSTACIRWQTATAATLWRQRSRVRKAYHARADAQSLVRVESVSKGFQHRGRRRAGKQHLRALDAVTFDLGAGESLAIVGESGSGKSTLLRIVAGLIPPDSGRCTMPDDTNPRMVFQDAASSLTPWLTVGELIGEQYQGRRGRAAKSELVHEALARVGLPEDVAEARPRELSGGQNQRVALARAVATPTKLLLADEPTSALDVSLAASVLNLIAELRTELSMAVMFVTHDLAVAKQVSDRIVVMNQGSIVEQGDTEQVVHRPANPYTQALVSAVPGAAPPADDRGEAT